MSVSEGSSLGLTLQIAGVTRACWPHLVEAPPYEGAKNFFLVPDEIDDGEWLSNLVRATEADLPNPKKRAKKKKTRKK